MMEEAGVYDVTDRTTEKGFQLFVDEVEAAEDGYGWLNALAKERKADNVTPIQFEGSDGGVAVAWKDGLIIAYFLLLRNWNNYTILVKNDLGEQHD